MREEVCTALQDACLADALCPPRGEPPGPPRNVLLTGVTGFLGGEIASALLRVSTANLYCLVRGSRSVSAAERLEGVCRRRGLERPRVSLIEGDLESLQSPTRGGTGGLDLDAGIDTIVHCAASVSLFSPYAAMRGPNVLGAHSVLGLAARGSPKSVHFISTGGVFLSARYRGQTVFEDAALCAESVPQNGYARSKWVADRMMARARERGYRVNVYRPTFVGWHSRTGEFGEHDLVALLLVSSMAAGCAPRLDLQINSTPVDHVARVVARLVTASSPQGGTYHIASRRAVRFVDLATTLGLEVVDFPTWTEAVGRASPRHAKLAALVEAAQASEASGSVELRFEHDRTYDDRRTRETLGAAYRVPAGFDERYLSRFAQRIGAHEAWREAQSA